MHKEEKEEEDKKIVQKILINSLEKIKCESCEGSLVYSGLDEYCNPNQRHVCYPNLYCSDLDHTCKLDNVGGECESGKECSSGLCLGDKCSIPKYNSEYCEHDEECLSDNCNLHQNQCEGLNQHNHCNPKNETLECDSGFFCSPLNNLCMPRLEKDQLCAPYLESSYYPELICQSGYYCSNEDSNSPSQETCRLLFSGEQGSQCGSIIHCQLGRICNNGVCSELIKRDQECNLTQQNCPFGSYCRCVEEDNSQSSENAITGQCKQIFNQDQQCQDILNKLVKCSNQFSCDSIFEYANGTCIDSNCDNILNDLQCCFQNGFQNSFYTNNGVVCQGTPVPQIPVITEDVSGESILLIVFKTILPIIVFCLGLFIMIYIFRYHAKKKKTNKVNSSLVSSSPGSMENSQPESSEKNSSHKLVINSDQSIDETGLY
ncbi:dd-gdca protein [Anaeramoeba flamelloides]|uniref:Dd-gdca protein n=1 Tax=Anaeramoeba flamelloides TaxID=1746091 RepID=A0AAV7YP79_9EUKA|nr:dd-gdca protein [Anaeramoeba flamelloides]